jgi:electron transport complex protein RnfC
MLSLIEQIKTGSLWDFPGGVHPEQNKQQSNQTSIVSCPLPKQLVLPLKQHIGKPGDILVGVGERVLKGQPLTHINAMFMLPIHAPTSGTVTAIESRTTAHPSGLSELSIVIETDGEEQWYTRNPVEHYLDAAPEQLVETIRQAGISGLGGAGFPTATKIQSGLTRTDILIINAAECEPYITADDRLMQDRADEILQGIEILEHILKPKLTVIGIEDNKPNAIKALEKSAKNMDIQIRVIPTKYPSGGEKQLIKILTNLEVPNNGIPADIGILVQNVGTAYAIKRAVIDGEPLIDRVVTLTGNAFKQPQNVQALIGTSIAHLLEHFDYKADKKAPRLIMGGPMMGFTLPHANVPITKTSNCILAPTYREIDPRQDEMACIRCSQCAEACPASLLPQQLQWYAKSQEYDKCEELNLKDCIECGACAFVCPSEIPLVQYYRQAKAEIRARKVESEAAERAKNRFEERKARLERDKLERENRFSKAATERRKEMKASGGDDAVAAAIARVKAQKEQSNKEVKPAVAAAIARAKAKQAQAAENASQEPDNSEMSKLREERKRLAREKKAQKQTEDAQAQAERSQDDKKTAVAEAIARAKARKAQQAQNPAETSQVDETSSNQQASDNADPKKAAVAAAIARAKARKAQQAQEPAETSQVDETSSSQQVSDDADPKKAAVAAAIARAKARKAQQAQEPTETSQVDEASSSQPVSDDADPKKAAVAAAIARAKARKAKQSSSIPEAEKMADDAQSSPAESNNPAEVSSVLVTDDNVDPKKAAVAAAIARAKARKAQQQKKQGE